MVSKRNFIKTLLITAAMPIKINANSLVISASSSPSNIAKPDDYWAKIREEYTLKPDYINLENGYYSMMAQPVLEAYLKDIRNLNREASYYMRTVQFDEKNKTKNQLAELVGCNYDELIITRNTTESLDIIISGIDWKKDDEAVMCSQDYGSMLDMFKQQSKRFGIVNKIIEIPLDPKTDEEIVDLYAKAITPKTRLLMICHMINITGQILPVKKICDMAHNKGVDVLVDGAHAIAHIDFKISDLNCDYYGSSLHKWLGAPLGSGILYVNKNKIKSIWPLFGELAYEDTDIRKLNHTGTISVPSDIAIRHAIEFHTAMGIKRKEERLRFLKTYWTDKIKNEPNIFLNTPSDPQRSCGIANVGIKNMKPSDLAQILMFEFKVWTVAIDSANVHGVRITPHLYTNTDDLDTFVMALKTIAKRTK
ncbi:MAG: aminotransferase class V-fold PLP-dependent enzyme [bacterium]|nr:aminotransferase class V-fold PLP-dependent enzyme [bacterium]